VEEVWDKPPAPYLRGVVDRPPGAPEDEAYCRDSPSFRWEETWSAEELAPILARNLADSAGHPVAVTAGTLDDIVVGGTGASGRVKDVIFVVKGHRYHVFGDAVRRVLRPKKTPDGILKSARIRIAVKRSGGHVTSVTVHGSGNGHGVGMCQAGALGMARRGSTWRAILQHYYPGIDIVAARTLEETRCGGGGVLLGYRAPGFTIHSPEAEIQSCNMTSR